MAGHPNHDRRMPGCSRIMNHRSIPRGGRTDRRGLMAPPSALTATRRKLSDWLGREDSNLRMPEPKSGALPLGDAPIIARRPMPGRTLIAPGRRRNGRHLRAHRLPLPSLRCRGFGDGKPAGPTAACSPRGAAQRDGAMPVAFPLLQPCRAGAKIPGAPPDGCLPSAAAADVPNARSRWWRASGGSLCGAEVIRAVPAARRRKE